ncbi:Elongator complex protein 5 [Cercophora newfieldiana]|uniref:Elongator complex protein 5 n=1 Tax=Cercophora newfieldiana TaxID=92897 RepID=A0AA39YFZ1_9PEZI|nr:Elongator complex protein 5 [Cercophora newfieldiana]
MAPSAQAHHRSHSLLLLQKLLNLRDSASPLTLICDTIEQSAGPLVREVISRAKIARSKVVFISLATVKKPHDAEIFIKARGKSLKALATEITSHFTPPPKDTTSAPQKYLLIFDTLNPLTTPLQTPLLPAFFTSILPTPSTSLVAIYHTDVPSPHLPPYTPPPPTLLSHLATTVFHVSSLAHAIESHRAASRSLPLPEFGLHGGREGVLVGLAKRQPGIVLDMEMRRRSGRAVAERFILTPAAAGAKTGASIMLLADHPLFAAPTGDDVEGEKGEEGETTFSLGLTEKQRKDREGIVLPYFDAQTDVGGGEGGRILYDMGREDDFDEEEDEI